LGIFFVFSIFVILLSLSSSIFSGYREYIFAIVMQTIALGVYVLTLIGYIKSGGIYYRNFEFWLIMSLTFAILSQIFFLPFLNIDYYQMLNLSTLAKFLSYMVLFYGFMHSIYEIYKSEEDAQNELMRKNLILSETKKKVEEAYLVLREEKWELSRGKNSADSILKDILRKK